MPLDDALLDAAERNGVQQDFFDIFGGRHYTTLETNRAILTALGFDCSSEESLRASLDRRAEAERRPLPPVLVVSENRAAANPHGFEVAAILISTSSLNRAPIIEFASRTVPPNPI